MTDFRLESKGGSGVTLPISLLNAGWGIDNTKTNISTNGTVNDQAVATVWLNFNGSSNPTNLTGLVAQTTATEVIITNNTSSGLPYTVLHQNSGSTAANRFDLPKSLDLTIPFKASVRFRYNGSRWNYVGGFITNFPVGSNGQLQVSDSAGQFVTVVSGLNYDFNNNRLAINAFAVSGDAQFVGNPRFLQQTTDWNVFFARSSGSDHGYLSSDSNFQFNATKEMLLLGSPSSPASRIHSLGIYATLTDPSVFTASLVIEVPVAAVPIDSPALVYQPVAPTSSGLGYDATQNVGSGGFTANGQTINGTVYEGRIIGGQLLIDPVGFGVTFTDTINDGVTAFSLDWVWTPSNNSDGSTPDFIIFSDTTTGFIYYISSGTATTFNDAANDPGSVPATTPFTGFTASGQMFSFAIASQGISPSGMQYYSLTPTSYSISDSLNNGTLLQIQHNISNSGSDGWKISQGLNQSQQSAGNTTFYQTATFSGGGDLTPQHYGILSDGSALNRSTDAYARNITAGEFFSTGATNATTTDPNDSNYYSITYGYSAAGADGIRAVEQINGGTQHYKDKMLGVSGTFYQDALGGSFTGTPINVSPTYRSYAGGIFENTSDDTYFVPQIKLKTTNANASQGFEMYEQSTLKASQKHYQSGNYEFFVSSGVFDFVTASSSGPTINFKNTSGTVIAGISGAGKISSADANISSLTASKPVFTDGSKNLTSSGTMPVASGGTGVTSLGALTKTDDTNVTLTLGGSPTTALVNASSLTLGWTGTLAVARGGRGDAISFKDNVALINQSADIAATNFTNGGTAGTYRVSYCILDTTADLTAGAVTLTFGFTDAAGSTTLPSAALPLTALGRTQGSLYIQLASGNITYSTTHTGLFGTSRYALYMTLERLS